MRKGEPTLTRGMTPDHYIGGLYSFRGLEKPVVLFVNENDIEFKGSLMSTEEMLHGMIPDKQFLKDIKFVKIKLENFYNKFDKHWKRSIEISEKYNNQLFCWHPPITCVRPDFFNYVYNVLNYDCAVWVDAALSNESYFPLKYGGTWHDWELIDWNNYYPTNKEATFNPKLGNRLIELTKNYGGVICGNRSMNQEPADFIESKLGKFNRNFAATGAIMGYSKPFFSKFYEAWNNALDIFIEGYDGIFTEIEILSYLNIQFNFAKLIWTNYSSLDEMTQGSMQDFFRNLIYDDKQICFNNTNV